MTVSYVRIISMGNPEGFSFKPINFNDVVIAISHFSSQARGADGIPQSVIVKALPVISNLLVKLFFDYQHLPSPLEESKHRSSEEKQGTIISFRFPTHSLALFSFKGAGEDCAFTANGAS